MGALKKCYRLFLALALVAAGAALERVGVVDYLSDPYELKYTLHLLWQHVSMAAVSLGFATFLGLAIGIVFTRPGFRRFSGVVMYVVGLGQTIPSLAIIALVLTVLGVGFETAVFALFAYSILPVARNTLAGIRSVPEWIIGAARGMGMPNRSILFQVELPNAMQVILTGFRVSLVMNIGTAALAYLVGAGGLGEHIFTGINLSRPDKLLAGAVPTTLLALSADYLAGGLGKILIPRGLRIEKEGR